MNKKDDDYYKPKRVTNFLNDNYTEYESNGDTYKNLSLEEYLDKIRPYFGISIAINFISAKDAEEERVMHSKSNNIKFTFLDELF